MAVFADVGEVAFGVGVHGAFGSERGVAELSGGFTDSRAVRQRRRIVEVLHKMEFRGEPAQKVGDIADGYLRLRDQGHARRLQIRSSLGRKDSRGCDRWVPRFHSRHPFLQIRERSISPLLNRFGHLVFPL